MHKLVLIAMSAVAALGLMPSAHAAGTTTIHLDVDVAFAAPLADCDVTVPAGANGVAVLDAAKASGCIASYRLKQYSFGVMVECINEVCQAPDETLNILYWAIYVNGSYASVGVQDLSLNSATLGFNFETWVTGVV